MGEGRDRHGDGLAPQCDREKRATSAGRSETPPLSAALDRRRNGRLLHCAGSRRAGAGAFCAPRLPLNGGHAGDNERCGECIVFWCVPHKGCGRGYSPGYPACNRKPRHCLSPNEGRSFALPRHAELHRAAGLFRISERGVRRRKQRKPQRRRQAMRHHPRRRMPLQLAPLLIILASHLVSPFVWIATHSPRCLLPVRLLPVRRKRPRTVAKPFLRTPRWSCWSAIQTVYVSCGSSR